MDCDHKSWKNTAPECLIITWILQLKEQRYRKTGSDLPKVTQAEGVGLKWCQTYHHLYNDRFLVVEGSVRVRTGGLSWDNKRLRSAYPLAHLENVNEKSSG